MTLKEFFRKARRGRKWKVGPGQYDIVRAANGDCPMEAVFGCWSPCQAEVLNHFPEKYGWKIVTAADASHDDADRKWLLKNLGIRA